MGVPTQSVWLDGDSDYISLVDNAAFDEDTACAMGLWICIDDNASDAAAYLLDRTNSYSLYLDDHQRLVGLVGSSTIRSPMKLKKDQPYLVAMNMYESGDDLVLELFVNDIMVKTQTFAATTMPAANANAFYIGADGGAASFFKGKVSSIFMTSDRVYYKELTDMHDSTTGQATDSLDNLVIDIDTEGDVVNDGTAGNGTAQGTAVPVTYLHITQSLGSGGHTLYMPAGEPYYRWSRKLCVARVTWAGDDIADGDTLCVKDKEGNIQLQYFSILEDQGGTWYFDDTTIWNGLDLETTSKGSGEVQIQLR